MKGLCNLHNNCPPPTTMWLSCICVRLKKNWKFNSFSNSTYFLIIPIQFQFLKKLFPFPLKFLLLIQSTGNRIEQRFRPTSVRAGRAWRDLIPTGDDGLFPPTIQHQHWWPQRKNSQLTFGQTTLRDLNCTLSVNHKIDSEKMEALIF